MDMTRPLKKAILRCEIIFGLAFSRLLIKLVPFRWWRDRIGPIDGRGPTAHQPLTEKQVKMAGDIGRMIKRLADKQKFDAVCLPQAMTGRWVLSRRGIKSQIVIGSKPDPEKGIALHAWLKVGEHIVTGADEYAEFQSFARSNQ